jgi:dienelactone hydrolase
LKALGTRITTVRPEGTAEMLVPPQLATVPERVLDEITNWFGEWRVPVAVHAPRIETCSSPFAIGRAYREQAVRFGPDDRLFGILTSPSLDALSAPAIILFNTAVEHHVGPHRLYVPLAREWAASGHLVLRFDLGGIGESAPPNGAPENVAYPDHMLDDAREAIAFLHEEAPGKPIILAGLCSGGWLAFQAARHGLPVDGIVSVNAPLYLRDGSAGRQWLTEQHELELYRDALRDRSMCVKELRGRDSYAMAARAVIRQIAVRVGGMFDGLPDGLSKDLAAIARRGIASLFIFSHGDDGLRYFQLHAAQVLRRPCVRDLVHHVVVEGAGHSFRPLAAQETLRTLMIDFVASQTGMTAARVPTPDHEVVAADDSL